MRDLVFAIPGDLTSPTGGYEYARRLIEHLPAQGVSVRHAALPGSFPAPPAADLDATAAIFAALPAGVPLLVDGLAYGALPPDVIAAAGDRPIVALVHHPLGLEAGLTSSREKALVASETAALALAYRVIVTSPYTARLLTDRFAVPQNLIRVARPGTEPAARVAPQGSHDVRLLAVGAVTPRKGYDVLLRALARLADLPWRLTIVGALDRAPDHVAALLAFIVHQGLATRVTLAGPVSDRALEGQYRGAHVLVSASLFEGYGMALAEGLARGLPIVIARGGAADETVPDAAALKTEPGDVTTLADALRQVVDDPTERVRLAEAAWEAGRALPRWPDTAAAVAQAVAEAAEGYGP